MALHRVVPPWIAALAAGLAALAPAVAKAETLQVDLGFGGGLMTPVYPAAARRNYLGVGPDFFFHLGGIGERFLLRGTVRFGFLSADTDLLAKDLAPQAPMGANALSGGTAWYAAGLVSGGVFFLGGGTPGGVYLSGGVGGGATWAEWMRYGNRAANGSWLYVDAPPVAAAPPFGGLVPRAVFSAALGATTGKRCKSPFLSGGAEIGTTFFVLNGPPIGLLTFTVQWGVLLPEKGGCSSP